MNTKGKIMRLLGQSAINSTSRDRTDATLFDSPKLRPRASQSLAFCTGKEILCLDRSPDGHKVVIAGSGIFKILNVEGSAIIEEIDLRAIIRIHSTNHSTTSQTSELNTNLTIIAVKWSHGPFNSIIIAASANGVITAYDLNLLNDGLEIARIQAHAREIYKLAISPHKPQWLLSASRDGTVKSWNIRSPYDDPHTPYFRHWHTFKCTSEVLDVEWSPTDGLAFACCTDLGQVLRWDLRDPVKPSLRINAHSGQCYSIAWHPNGEHVASGGKDQFCYVWNLSKTGKKNQNALHTLETRAPISCVSWRPAFWSATAHGRRSAQITITYRDDRKMDALVEIWDLARPTMPFKQLPYKPRPTRKMIDDSLVKERPELRGLEGTLEDKPPCDEGWDTAPIGILWISRDLLWTINSTIGTTNSGHGTVKEGWFIQSDIAFVPNLIEQRSLSNLAFSSLGDILMILEQRQASRQHRVYPTMPEVSPLLSRNNSGPNLSSRSPSNSEEEVFGSFLGPRRAKGLGRSSSSRSNQTCASSPRTHGMIGDIMSLEESVNMTGIYQPQQVMAIGKAPFATNELEYSNYSCKYFMRLLEVPPADEPPDERITWILEDYARLAESFGNYRLAQTWRFLGMSMSLLFIRRVEYHRNARLKRQESTKLSPEPAYVPNMTPRTNRNREKSWKRTKSDIMFHSVFHDIARDTISEETESSSYPTTSPVRLSGNAIHQETRDKPHMPLVHDEKSEHPETTCFAVPSSIPVPKAGRPKSDAELYEPESFVSIDSALPSRNQPDFVDHIPNEEAWRIQTHHHDSSDSFEAPSTFGLLKKGSFVSSESCSDQQGEQEDTPYYGTQDERNCFDKACIDYEAQLQMNCSSETPINNNHSMNPASLPICQSTLHPISETNQTFLPSDFLHDPNDPLFTLPALDPATILQQIIIYHTTTSSKTIHIIPMLLLLLPYLPPNTVDPLHVSQMIAHVHARLNSLQLYIEAALLRNLCVPTHPEIYSMSQHNIRIGFFCTTCDKPFDPDPRIPNAHWICPRCEGMMAHCPICEQREYIQEASEPEPVAKNRFREREDTALPLGTWWYCPGCAHGGHVACMQEWHAASEPGSDKNSLHSKGACPVVGCLHSCLPGDWRDQLTREKEVRRELRLVSRECMGTTGSGIASAGSGGGGGGQIVSKDMRDLVQSYSVEDVRVALDVFGNIMGESRRRMVRRISGGGRTFSRDSEHERHSQ